MTARIQAGDLNPAHSVQFGGVLYLLPTSHVIFPTSPSTCALLAKALFALGQILSCVPGFTNLGGQGVAEGRFWLNERISLSSLQWSSKWLTGSCSLGRDVEDSALKR